MKPSGCTCGRDAVVVMNDVWLCLEDVQARLEQRSRTLKQALDMLRSVRHVEIDLQEH